MWQVMASHSAGLECRGAVVLSSKFGQRKIKRGRRGSFLGYSNIGQSVPQGTGNISQGSCDHWPLFGLISYGVYFKLLL